MAEHGTATVEPEVELVGERSLAQQIKDAELAIANIKPTMQTGEVFPGSIAFNSVMNAVVMAGENSNRVIEGWQVYYEELIENFDYTDPEKSVAELKVKLEEFLASAKEKLGQGVEKGQAE